MAAGRSLKSLVSRRRRTADDGEEEDGLLVIEDSQSEGSVGSKADDEELDASSVEGRNAPRAAHPHGSDSQVKSTKRPRRSRKKGQKDGEVGGEIKDSRGPFPATTDTEMMLHGTRTDLLDAEPVSKYTEDASRDGTNDDPSKGSDATVERQPKDQEELRKKRDTDPSFTPNRGAFFMHDTRGQSTAHSGPPVRGAWQGRGRGRGSAVVTDGPNTAPPHNNTRVEPAAEQPWKHDLHDTINEDPQQSTAVRPTPARFAPARASQGSAAASAQGQQRVITFSTTKLLGTVQIRVNLPGMTAPITFADVPWKHYTRLPNHRPPLRRDKPVRVSLPPNFQRYIFPSPERSFIFIPRQMRPNQQGYHRNAYQRSIGGYGYSSRRTSLYGGSVYSASVAGSRRSSITGMPRPDGFSPVPLAGVLPPYNNRPTVRLPYGNQGLSAGTTPTGPLSDRQTPTRPLQLHTYPLPQQPAYQGTPTTMMHQPKPQKAISVTGIESPAALQQAPLGEEVQPFQGQLAHIHDAPSYGPAPGTYYSPRQQYVYPSQAQMGTPLSGIPEQSMYAQSYHPSHMPYAQPPYFPGYPPHNYYYPGPGASAYPSMPPYTTAHGSYTASPAVHASPAQTSVPRVQSTAQTPDGVHHGSTPSQAPSGMVAHESNGMVFYLPASEAQNNSRGENYQPAESFVPSYAMPGLPPPTPAPENTPFYYPAMAMGGAQAPVFYPHTEPQT